MSIKAIADKAGVSPATVSRVLNNPDYRCADPGARDRIWQAAIEMNYVPNEAARNLKQGVSNARTYRIQILVTRTDSSPTDPFFREMLHIIESEIHNHLCMLTDVQYISAFSHDGKYSDTEVKKMVLDLYGQVDGGCDGLIIIGKCNQQILRALNRQYGNVVSVNRNSTNYEVDEVLCDGEKIASMAVEHLVKLGHRRIGYVGDCHNEARFRGFIDVLQRHDIDVVPEYVIEARQTEQGGYRAMERVSALEDMPTGIYCANDITAIGMQKYMAGNKKFVYRKLSLVASDDIEAAQSPASMLTTVRLPKEEMGRFAVYLLLDRIRGGHSAVARMELEGKLIQRDSCQRLEEN